MARVLRSSAIALFVYGGLIALTWFGFSHTPTGFVPPQDKQYLVAYAQLPDAATLDRTEAVIKRMSVTALATPGVESVPAFPGLVHQRLHECDERWNRVHAPQVLR